MKRKKTPQPKNEEKTYYDRLLEKLKNNKYIAWILVGFITVGAVTGLVQSWEKYFPEKTKSVQQKNRLDDDSLINTIIDTSTFVEQPLSVTSANVSISCSPFYQLTFRDGDNPYSFYTSSGKSSLFFESDTCDAIFTNNKGVWYTSGGFLLTTITITFDKGDEKSQILINEMGIEVYPMKNFPERGVLYEYLPHTAADIWAAEVTGKISSRKDKYPLNLWYDSNTGKDIKKVNFKVLNLGETFVAIASIPPQENVLSKQVFLRPYVEYTYHGQRLLVKSKNGIKYLFLKQGAAFNNCEPYFDEKWEAKRDSLISVDKRYQKLVPDDWFYLLEKKKGKAYIDLEKLVE